MANLAGSAPPGGASEFSDEVARGTGKETCHENDSFKWGHGGRLRLWRGGGVRTDDDEQADDFPVTSERGADLHQLREGLRALPGRVLPQTGSAKKVLFGDEVRRPLSGLARTSQLGPAGGRPLAGRIRRRERGSATKGEDRYGGLGEAADQAVREVGWRRVEVGRSALKQGCVVELV